MANLAISKVTILDSYTTDGNNGRKFSARRVEAILLAQGGLTNKVPASALSLRDIVASTPAVASDNTVYLTTPSYDGSFVIFLDDDNAAADVTSATVRFTVKGHP